MTATYACHPFRFLPERLTRRLDLTFVLSGVIMLGLMIVTAENHRTQLRLILLGAIRCWFVGRLAMAPALSRSTRSPICFQRQRAGVVSRIADVGSGGRFHLQDLALTGNPLNYPLRDGVHSPLLRAYHYQQQRLSAGVPRLWLPRRLGLCRACPADTCCRVRFGAGSGHRGSLI